ncbi:MAG TPA: hypothetical protein VKU83_05035 [Puia sp.]|nr:hypothetical protein [Puia sp.]
MTTERLDTHPEKDPRAGDDARLLRKQIGSTRTFLYIAAALNFISALLLTPNLPSPATVVNITVTCLIGGLYILLAFRAGKKPYTAIRLGLLLLVLVVLADILVSPIGPFNRWQSKLLTLVMLLMGLADSRDAQRKMSKPKTA